MSEYPHAPYGTGYNSQDQNNPPYHPPTYPNQYAPQNDGLESQGHVPSGYNASMAAYGYNNALPAFGAMAVPSSIPPLPMFTGWNQETAQTPAYNNNQHYAGYGNSTTYNSQYYQQTPPTNYQQNVAAAKPFEKADLSEGEFEGSAVAHNTPPVGYGTAQYQDRDTNGYYNTAHRAVHSKAQDYSPRQSSYSANNVNYSVPETSLNKRQKSGSYSPYVSPSVGSHVQQHMIEPSHDTSVYTPSNAPEASLGASQIRPSSGSIIVANLSRSEPVANGFATSPNGVELDRHSYPAHPAQGPSASAGKSVAESRKKAQGAILSLWPHDVRYQTYVDEGFKIDTVDKLFDDLHLPKVTLPSRNIAEQAQNVEAQSQIPKSGGQRRLSKGADATNSHPVTKYPTPTPSSVKAAVDSKPAASEEMVEKQKKLETKMELLRRSREERAQKAAAAKNVRASSAAVPATKGNGLGPVVISEQAASVSNSPQVEVEPQTQPSASAVATIDSEPQPPTIPGIQSLQQPSSLPQRPTLPSQQFRPPSPLSSQPAFQPISMSIQQQTPAIPGLFLGLTSSAPISTSPIVPKDIPTSTQLNHRKRPVAADFDEPTTTMASFKRPFGHTRTDQPLVIHVSEDEDSDEDVAMDIESSQADQDSPLRTSFQNLPPPNFPVRRPIVTPKTTSTSSTPPVGPPHDQSQTLQSKIEELKQKIARAEAAKRAKKTPNGNGTRTPQRSETTSSDTAVLPTTSKTAASTVEAMIQIQQEIGVADNEAALDEQRLADEQTAEVQKAAELKKSQAEQRRLQRSKMASDISLIEAETVRQKAELEKLRADMAEREAALQKGLEDRQRMAEEMDRLGLEAEDQLQAENSKLEALVCEGDSSKELLVEPPTSAPESPSFRSSEAPSSHHVSARTSVEPREHTSPASPAMDTGLNGATHKVFENVVSQDSSVEPEAEVKEDSTSMKVMENTISNDQALEAALQEAARAQADSHSQDDGEIDEATYMDEESEMETSFAPNPSQLAPASPASPMRDVERSPTYSPVLSRNLADAEDDYEPPDATPPEPTASVSPPFSPAPPVTIDEPQAEDEITEASLPATTDEKSGEKEVEEALNVDGWLQQAYGTKDPKLPTLAKSHLFTPYESPLKNFHAYRFHSEYSNGVSGGLRSMTYSNKIDPSLEFCRYELAGGICNDPTCTEQHFRDIKLPDDAVLTALGSPEEFVGEQRDEFCTGLKEVLVNLRVRKIRDFDIIAKEIVAYRANFLGDKSKVLPLEGVQL